MDSYNWISTKYATDGIKQLFNNPFLSDIIFEFPDGRILFGHRTFVAMRSRILHEEFNSSSDTFKIDDYSYNAYKEFLSFLYTNECIINEANCVELLYLAIHHSIQTLYRACNDYFMRSNLFKFYEVCDKNNWRKMGNSVVEHVKFNFDDIISNMNLLHIKPETLDLFLRDDDLDILSEYTVFDIVMKWARYECDKRNEHDNGFEKRKILGRNLFLIRFAAMTCEEFAKCVEREPDLLTSDEISSIFLNISINKRNKYGFCDVKRAGQCDMSTESESSTVIRLEESNINGQNLDSKSKQKLDVSMDEISDDSILIEDITVIENNNKVTEEQSCPVTSSDIVYSSNDITKNITDSRNLSSICFDVVARNYSKTFYFNRHYFNLSVSKSIMFCGLYFHGKPRLVKFELLIKESRKSILNFESTGDNSNILTKPTLLHPNIMYCIAYSFGEWRDCEEITWAINHKFPIECVQNEIKFYFNKAAVHITKIFYQPCVPFEKSDFIVKDKYSDKLHDIDQFPLDSGKQRAIKKYSTREFIPTENTNNVFRIFLTPCKQIIHNLSFKMVFSVSHAIVLSGITFNTHFSRDVEIKIMDDESNKLLLTKYGNTCNTIPLSSTIIQPRRKFKILYMFTRRNAIGPEILTASCKRSTPWNDKINDCIFTVYCNSAHINAILFR